MPVTELALIRILPQDHPVNSSDIVSLFSASDAALYSYNQKSFIYFQQIEDPNYIYIFGDWESAEEHYTRYVPSEPNQQALKSLKDRVEVVWLQHLEVDREDLPLVRENNGVIGIGRHYMTKENRVEFERLFDERKGLLHAYATRGTPTGGWRLEWDGEVNEKAKEAAMERQREEWVLISPWADVAEHTAFEKTDTSDDFKALREILEEVDIKHARRIKK